MEAIQEEVGRLVHLLAKVNMEMVEKVEQIKKLSKKVAELKAGKGLRREAYPNEHLRNDPKKGLKNLAKILPAEVLGMIFNELSDGADLLNLLNACSLFRKVLRKRIPTFLFPQAFPALCKHLEGDEILQCREVCKTWSYGVDHFLENHKSLRPHDDENCDPRDPPFVSPMEEKMLYTPTSSALKSISRKSSIRPGEKTVTMPGRNPFIGREIVIDNWKYETAQKVLKLYGQHIWYLTVHTDRRWECNPACCLGTFEHVSTILQNIPPNLRKLRIINAKDEPFHPYNPEDSRRYPTHDNLETLHFDTSPSGIHRGLSDRYHLQLRRVHMRAAHWLSVYNLGWPALVELHLQDLSTNDDHYDSLLQAEMPNLRKFGCGSKKDDCDSKDMLDRLLKIINNLSETTRLSTVRFNGDIFTGWSTHSIEEFRAYAPPSLKTLEMEHFCDYEDDLTDYSILLHFPFLENINVYWRGVETFDNWDEASVLSHSEQDQFSTDAKKAKISDSELVQVNRYINQKELYKSNIWELLPRLKVLTFQLDLYTREGYDNFKKWKNGNNVQ